MAYKDKEVAKVYYKERYLRKREEILEAQRIRNKAKQQIPKEIRNAARAEYLAKPGSREKARAASARWSAKNLHKHVQYARTRRAKKVGAIPGWFSEFDALVMLEAADLCQLRAKTTGIKWHIDHIVPLVSSRVCGLHIGCNIQVIPAVENQAKGNRHWPDMP